MNGNSYVRSGFVGIIHDLCVALGSLGFSLAPGKFEWYLRYLIFQIIAVIDGWVISCELALRWMLLDLTDDKSTLVQVMAWCRQATSHYLSQCWPKSLSPHGVTRPQWVNSWLMRIWQWWISIVGATSIWPMIQYSLWQRVNSKYTVYTYEDKWNHDMEISAPVHL